MEEMVNSLLVSHKICLSMALIPQLLERCQEFYRITLINPFFFSLLFLCLLFLLKFIKGGVKLNLPPAPPRLPIIGHIHLLGTLPYRSFKSLSKTYGPIMLLYLGRVPTLVVTSEEVAKEIMKTQDMIFVNRARPRAAETLLYGCRDIGFAPYGEYWRQMRRICVLKLLTPERVQSFHFVREEVAVELMEQIRSASLNGASIKLGEMLIYTSSSIVSGCVLGRVYFGKNKKRFDELGRTATELLGGFFFGDFFPSFGWVDVLTGKVKILNDTSEGLDVLLDEMIEEHRSSKKTTMISLISCPSLKSCSSFKRKAC